jgi:HEAT repeat protein
MFDFLRRGDPSAKQIQRTVKRLTEPGGEEGPRVEAAEKLADWGTPDALYGLLQRFTMSSKVISQDIEEKGMVVRMLVSKGPDAVEPILRFVKTRSQVEWPLRALVEILPEKDLAPKLMEVLDHVAQSAFSSPEHRSSLIRFLHGRVTPDVAGVIRRLMSDDDDDVRIAAIEAIAEAGEDMREALLEAFLDAADRPRIRIRIAEIFSEREWPVKGYRPKVEEALPQGFSINSKGLIRRR